MISGGSDSSSRRMALWMAGGAFACIPSELLCQSLQAESWLRSWHPRFARRLKGRPLEFRSFQAVYLP